MTSGTPVPVNVTVDYVINVTETTATLDDDYLQPSGTVTMLAGDNSANITVDLVNDDLWEDVDYLALDLVLGSVAPAGVARVDITRSSAVGEIMDDDPEPYLFLVAVDPNPPQVVEGDQIEFEVRLRDQQNMGPAPSAGSVTVDFKTEDGTATAANDYTAPAESLTFDSGVTSIAVTVQTVDDSLAEPDETFEVVLKNGVGAEIGGSSATVTILDNEATVSVAAAQAEEGEQLEFELRVVWPDPAVVPTPPDVDVTYQLVDYTRAPTEERATQGACGVGVDYELPSATTATITHPDTTATIQVQTCDDALVEPDEQFWLELSTVTDAVAVPAHPENGAVGTILNDDIPVLSVGHVTAERRATR